jgi:gamma-glutamylputrescine oxidase
MGHPRYAAAVAAETVMKIEALPHMGQRVDLPDFPDHPLYFGNPWFLPVVGSYYRLRDRLDRLLS